MVKETEFYDRLGIPPTATEADIKKGYKKMAVKFHPDKNPNNPDASEKFKEVGEAYEALSDEKKRKLYDQYGKEALKDGGGGGHSAEDIFSAFFGGGGGGFGSFFGGGQRGPRKGEDIVHELACTLEELYNGKTTKLAVTRNIICGTCEGSGSKPGVASGKCKGCDGKGVRIVVKQFGPGMIQQMRQTCPDCGGKGETIKEEDKCKNCKGKKVIKEKKILQVYIDKGMKHGQKIAFSGEADEEPGVEAGDIIFIITEKKHDTFVRTGSDLGMEVTIPLIEALGGFSFTVKHLDDRVILVKSVKGEVINHGDIRVVPNEGMPIHTKPFEKGNLVIKFHVEFPKPGQLTPKQITELEKLLPARRPAPKVTEDMEQVELVKVTDQGKRPTRGREAYEEGEDEEGQQGQRVQCAQQ